MTVKDGIVVIASEVLGDVQKEAEATILAAQNEAKEALKAAKQQADENYEAKISQAQAKAEAEKRKIASVTEVEIRNRVLQTKEELVDAAFQSALNKLKEFIDSPKYHDYIFGAIEALAKSIGQSKLVVQVNAKDKAWLNQDALAPLSTRLNVELKLSEQAGDFIGGVRVQTLDGKISYDDTIDNRLGQLKSAMRVEAAKILFGKEA